MKRERFLHRAVRCKNRVLFYLHNRLSLLPLMNMVAQRGIRRALAKMLYRKGLDKCSTAEYTDAIQLFSAAITLDAAYAHAYFSRGVAKTRQGDLIGAQDDYDRVIDFYPDVSLVYSNRGLVKTRSGDPRGALEDFQKAIELDPVNPAAYFHRGLVKGSGGTDVRALVNIVQAARLGNADAMIWLEDHGFDWSFDCN
ncbi:MULTISPECIES: tetratricopeptide repeat protein [Prosthecochloris]|uniref:Tetratricopeptide repeat protein n=1 Tax=Prosthecochloris vibrioformis TaxID=1098 RepID=A0A5C4S106_PROVB|nr:MULTISPECIES: tetratricopeptide repeat protein [Prosthecochloris]ANT64962.1 lipoprotein NlpI [Prosthecochloris sp. CIB 2401]TNJ36965.1 tetratricopeptide repeat protein [Prosthecochloris vibrioformis]